LNSSQYHPAPTPISSRPPDATSTHAETLARYAEFRYGVHVTIWPSRTRSVRPASAIIDVQHSNTGVATGGGGMEWKWS
jgi:hypothetical protein